MDPRCRIGRVIMKGGGADVRVLRGPPQGDRQQKLMRHARIIAEQTQTMAGFVILGWDSEGSYQIGFDADGSKANPIPLTLLPAWVSEVIRREAVTTRQIHDVLQHDYIVTPPQSPSG